MRIIERIKQGIEVEGYIRDMAQIESITSDYVEAPSISSSVATFAPKLTNKYFGHMHGDTGNCTEIATLPYDNLGDLMDSMRDIFGTVIDVCNSKGWVYMLLGVTPVAGHGGGHIHVSYSGSKNTVTQLTLIRNTLRRFQPFIILLGQNSPMDQGHGFPYRADLSIMDSRLRGAGCNLQHRSFEGVAYDNFMIEKVNYGSLEVRHPSVSPIYQAIGTCVFIKACMQNKPKEVSITTLQDLTVSSVNFGARASVNLHFNNGLGTKTITVGKLLQLIMNNSAFSECLGGVLEELPHREIRPIKAFFESFFNGVSMTPYYYQALRDHSAKKACQILHTINKEEVRGTPVYKLIRLEKPLKRPVGQSVFVEAEDFDITQRIWESVQSS